MPPKKQKQRYGYVDEEEKTFPNTTKISNTLPKETEKAIMQSGLGSFFGIPPKPAGKQHGKAEFDSFKNGKVSIWSWNVNGINARSEKNIL